MTDRSYESLPATVDGRRPRPVDEGDPSEPWPWDGPRRPATGLRAPRRIEPRSLVVAGVRPRAYIVHPEDELSESWARGDRFARVRLARPASPTTAGKAPPRRDSPSRLSRIELAAWAGVLGAGIGVGLAALLDSIR